MQANFLKNLEPSEKEAQIAAQIEVLRECVTKDYPIAVLEYSTHGETIPELREIIDQAPRHEYIIKNRNDGFNNARLNHALQFWNVKQVCIMGINTAYCVISTAKSAVQNGYSLITAKQLIAGATRHKVESERAIPWFVENGIYFPSYKVLLQEISSS